MKALIIAIVLLLPGCTVASNAFTNPTGQVTIPRQEFINTYSFLYVLTKDFLAEAEEACKEGRWPEANCVRIPTVKQELIVFDLNVRAKIAVPESEIDWAVIIGILKALAGLRP